MTFASPCFFFYVFSLVHKMKRKRTTPVRVLFNEDSVQKSHSMKLPNLKRMSNISLWINWFYSGQLSSSFAIMFYLIAHAVSG